MRPVRASAFRDAVPLDRRGHRSAATLDAINLRNELLLEAARRFFAGASDREAARQLRAALSRYREGRWRRDRSEATCPPRHLGRLDEMLWMILKVRDHVPPSERLIRLVLSRTNNNASALG